MIRALLFDMDGLLIDTEHLYWEVARAIAADFGKTVSDETLRATMGRDRRESCRILIEGAGIPMSVDDFMHRREQMMLEKFRAAVTPMPGVHEILRRFTGRLKLAVATSSPRMLASAALPAIDVEQFFDAIVTGDEIEKGKPNPDIYLKAMQKVGAKPTESIVLEDAPTGALAGANAGAFVIAVPSALVINEDFSKVSNVRVTNLSEASDQIERMLHATTETRRHGENTEK